MKKLLLFAGAIFTLMLLYTSCNKDGVDESIEFIETFEAQKSFVKSNMAADKYGYNWKAHTFQGSVFNAMIGDPLNEKAPFYGWEPYWGDDKAYLKLAKDEGYYFYFEVKKEEFIKVMFWEDPDKLPFWQYRNMNLKSKNYGIYDDDGVPQFPWVNTEAWIIFNYAMGEGADRWSQMQKFIAVRSTDILNEDKGIWYSKEGEEVGLAYMWPNLAVVQVVNTGNVPPGMMKNYKSPSHRGLSNKN